MTDIYNTIINTVISFTNNKLNDNDLSKYNISKLGKGGQANVYKITYENKDYAIRIPKDKLSEHELKILKTIQKTPKQGLIEILYIKNNIIITPVYDYDMNIWMNDKHTDKEWEVFIKDFKIGIESLSSLGICHRDLKPRNILVKNNRFYITDFGHSLIKSVKNKTTVDIDICINTKQDYEHINSMINRIKVNNMLKNFSKKEIFQTAQKYKQFESYHKNEQTIIFKKNISFNLKNFLLLKSICYFLVEKNDKISNKDGLQKLPSLKIQQKLKKEFSFN